MAETAVLFHPLVHGHGNEVERVVRQASYGRFYNEPPQLDEGDGARTWLLRGANFVIAVSDVEPGAELARADNADEYMVLLPPETDAAISTDKESIDARGDSLTIVPPGKSSVRAKTAGRVVRIFSNRARDLGASASNAANYADGAPEVAPIIDWPQPEEGYRLRNYYLPNYSDPKFFGRIFRSTNLMINVFDRKDVRRDPSKMSPHSHDDFEQASLTLEGSFVHHLRVPWTPNMALWREDEHVAFDSPSILVIPAKLVHTTQDVGSGRTWLVDIFAPPRIDFSRQPGLVRNADEYPMPSGA